MTKTLINKYVAGNEEELSLNAEEDIDKKQVDSFMGVFYSCNSLESLFEL